MLVQHKTNIGRTPRAYCLSRTDPVLSLIRNDWYDAVPPERFLSGFVCLLVSPGSTFVGTMLAHCCLNAGPVHEMPATFWAIADFCFVGGSVWRLFGNNWFRIAINRIDRNACSHSSCISFKFGWRCNSEMQYSWEWIINSVNAVTLPETLLNGTSVEIMLIKTPPPLLHCITE